MSDSNIEKRTEVTILQFLETAAYLERRLDRALSATRGISFSEYRLLSALSSVTGNGIPRIDLANAVGLTASAVTRALKPLEKIGLVTTLKSERDARQSLAVITSAGLELLDDAHGVLHDLFKQLFINTLSTAEVTAFQSRLSEIKHPS
ncbi:MAG: DNA-binding MarR family transcriptional regulator [Candidatus Azotimanducaceae bacterium]|jgi:DNA-binding MarR family transcriptional regulator